MGVTKPCKLEINDSTVIVSGNCHKVLQNAQTSCLGLSFETINNELWHLEGVKTILTTDKSLDIHVKIYFLCN